MMLFIFCRTSWRFYQHLVFIFILTTGYAQQSNYLFTHYTTHEGLSNNIITSVIQDSRGLLWIGTSNGLNFFDGVSFQSIFPTDFNNDFHSDHVEQVFEGAGGKILFITSDGIEEYDRNTRKLKLVIPQPKKRRFSQFVVDQKKNLWVLGGNYLHQYTKEYKLIDNITVDTIHKKENSLGAILCVDVIGDIWFSFNYIIYKWSAGNHTLESKLSKISHRKIFDLNVDGITVDSRGNYWATGNKLYYYNKALDSLSLYNPENNTRLGVSIISRSGNLFINGNYNGLYIFDTLAKKFQIIKHNESNQNTPSDNIFRQSCEDREGNIWLATNYGLDKCTPLLKGFIVLDNFGNDDTTKTSNRTVIRNITAYKKNLFVSTSAGLYKIHATDLSKQNFRYDKYNDDPRDDYWLSIPISDNSMLASSWKGFVVYDVNEKKLHPYSFPISHPALMDSVPIVSAFKDSRGSIWFGMFGGNGIFRWSKRESTFTKFDLQQQGQYHTPIAHFSNAAEDDSGNIWMGCDKGGLAIFDVALQQFVQLASPEFSQLNDNVIHDIINDHMGNLWLSTSSGLYRYSLKAHQLKLYNRQGGLISNLLTGIAMDKNGFLWLGNYSGLSKFDTSSTQFTNFTTADGLPEEHIETVIYDSWINKICCISDHQVILFDPYSLKKTVPVLSPVITSFDVMGKERSLDSMDAIKLFYKEDFFSLNYTAPDFVNSSDIRYAYKLIGFNKDWVYAGKQQYAGYTNLPGGDYVFKLKASADGVHWFEMHESVAIHIQTPFFKTLWFYFIISVSVVMITFLLLYSAYRAQLKRIFLAQKIRNDIASDLHDDIGSSLSSIMIMSELAKKRQEGTSNYFDRIKENAGIVIQNMNDIVWAVNPVNDTVEQMFIRMRSYASALLENKNIQFQLLTAESLFALKLNMEERKNFFLIFKEAVHNAFKYAGCTKITVTINQRNKAVLMTICDDGRGFDPVKKYIGNGLNNMSRRATQIKGQLEINSAPGEGTRISIIFKPTRKGS